MSTILKVYSKNHRPRFPQKDYVKKGDTVFRLYWSDYHPYTKGFYVEFKMVLSTGYISSYYRYDGSVKELKDYINKNWFNLENLL